MQKLVLIDGNSIINRAFYGMPDLSNSQGVHTNAVLGFMNILLKIMHQEQPAYLAVAFDLKGPTFRHEMFSEYKGNRKGMPEELAEQMPLLKKLLQAMKISIVELSGYEADDLLGTLAKRGEAAGMEVSVISGDRDLLQLVTEKVMVRIPKTKASGTEIEDYRPKDVLEKYQVTPRQIIELKALMGDSSDNYSGVPGIGEKGATRIIVEFGSVEKAYENVESVEPAKARNALKEHYDMALLCKKLATIDQDAPLDYDFEQARITTIYTKEAYEVLQKLELKKLNERFRELMEKQDSSWEMADGDSPFPDAEKLPEVLVVSDLEKIEETLCEAEKQPAIGLALAGKEKILAAAISWEEDRTFVLVPEGFVTPDFLQERIEKLVNQGKRCSLLSLKRQLHFYGFENRGQWFDGEIAAYLLNPLKNAYSYEDLARTFLEKTFPARSDYLGKADMETGWEEKREQVIKLLGYEACVSFAIVEPIQEELKVQGMDRLFKEIEMPLVFVLAEMEKAGIKVNGQALEEYGAQLTKAIEKLEQEIYQMAGESFNLNSPKQLGEILFVKMGLPGGKKTKTGFSTSAEVLEKLEDEHEIVQKILEYRQLAKLNSTYAQGLIGCIQEDGRIHSTFQQTITATGRLSSVEPNLQNIPVRMELGRLIRKVFVPEEGNVFIDGDYSQIELRVMAHLSGDETLINAYRQEEDIHRITASQVFHVPLDEVTPQLRRNAKAVNFGIIYGISSFGLSRDLSISRKEASQYREQYFATYPGVKKFMDRMVEEAKEKGYVTTLFGRRRPIPELKSSNHMQRAFGERVAMNSPVQGAAADIIKIAMIRVSERMKEEGLTARLLLQVHDELLIEAPKREAEQVRRILEEEMQKAAKLSVSLEIDMHTGKDWYEAK